MPFYVATLYLFRFIFHFIFRQHCADGLVGFRHKNSPEWVCKKTRFCRHKHGWRCPCLSFEMVCISSDVTLSNVDTQSQTVVSGFPAFLPILQLHHHHIAFDMTRFIWMSMWFVASDTNKCVRINVISWQMGRLMWSLNIKINSCIEYWSQAINDE